MWEHQPCRHQGWWGRRGGGPQELDQRFSCSPWCRCWWSSSAPAALESPWWNRDPFPVHGGPLNRDGGCLKEAVTPWETHTEAGFWQDLWREETTLEQVCGQDPWGICTGAVSGGLHPVEGTHAGRRNAAHGKHLHWRSLWKTLSHGREKQLEKYDSEVRKEEGRDERQVF